MAGTAHAGRPQHGAPEIQSWHARCRRYCLAAGPKRPTAALGASKHVSGLQERERELAGSQTWRACVGADRRGTLDGHAALQAPSRRVGMGPAQGMQQRSPAQGVWAGREAQEFTGALGPDCPCGPLRLRLASLPAGLAGSALPGGCAAAPPAPAQAALWVSPTRHGAHAARGTWRILPSQLLVCRAGCSCLVVVGGWARLPGTATGQRARAVPFV